MTVRAVVSLSVFFAASCAVSALAEVEVRFNRDVRPILSDKCFACHGPDEESRAGGFRLDLRDTAIIEADSGLVPIVPGDPNASELVRRVESEDEYERMPPPESHKTLSAEEIEILKRWIVNGAEWQKHWSLIPPQSIDPPDCSFGNGKPSAIDRFIYRRQEEEGFQPAPQADRTTLVRRVAFDLTGLPPTLEQVEEFLADKQPGAYERMVERFLSSERFGEHIARYWLDAARYGDTHGLHLDNYREMWPYRDWVVSAFNENKPFDQFVVEQLAGDLLPEPSIEQLVATGFNRCHVSTNEGGSIAEEVYVRNVVDRVDTFGTVFMGMTVGCTRCHDHKYDPLTMRDYYSLFGYFNSLDGKAMDDNRMDPAPALRVPTPEQEQALAELNRKISELSTAQLEDNSDLNISQMEWEDEVLSLLGQPGDPEATEDDSEGQGTHFLVIDGWHSAGPFHAERRHLQNQEQGPEGKAINLQEEFDTTTGEKISWQYRPDWADGRVHLDLPGDEAANFLYRKIDSERAQKIVLSLGSDDGIKVYHNGKEVLKKIAERTVKPDQESLELELVEGENHLLLKIINYQGASGFYFQIETDLPILPLAILEVASISRDERTEAQKDTLRCYYRNNISEAPLAVALREKLLDKRRQMAEIERQVGLTLVWKEKEKANKSYILNRGEYDQRGEEVERMPPKALPDLPEGAPNDRLGLARWLLAPEHPLTARVTVNRFWQQLFGTGLVKTAEDFGSQGELPSHPQLLDWLAIHFRETGWDVKALYKELVMTDAYRRSSRVDPTVYEADLENRLLARGPRFRLDGEMLRDQALAVGGLLVNRLGGPSVKPPQPDGLWFAVGYTDSNTAKFVADKGHDKVHRRSLYTFIKRTAPPPQMGIFDGPSRESCVVRRERTNTPLQALLLLNDPQYVETARGLAERILQREEFSVKQRAEYMFRLCTSRTPTGNELERLCETFEEEMARYAAQPELAEKLVAEVGTRSSQSFDRTEFAAWTIVANVLLNLDEVVTKN